MPIIVVTLADWQLINSYSRVLPEKLTCPKLLKQFPAFYETRKFITAFTIARHLSPSWTRSIQSMSPIWLLEDLFWYSSIYAWVFQMVSFPQVSPLKPCMHLFSSPYMLHVLPISVFLSWSLERCLVRSTEHKASSWLTITCKYNKNNGQLGYIILLRTAVALHYGRSTN